MSSPYSDLDRPPLSAPRLRRALLTGDGLWTGLDLRSETGSTNVDAADAARHGAAEGLVVVAERQRAGRGRLGRVWESPPRAGLAVSVLLRPGLPVPARGWSAVPAGRYGWLPLLAGVAVVESVTRLAKVPARLKWPNDLLIGDRKCAGILAEAVPETAVVLGIGLNVTLRESELPRPDVTSLALAGAAATDREPLLVALLRSLADWYRRWRATGGDPVACGLDTAYRSACATLGQELSVALPDGTTLLATGSDVDSDGRLVLVGPAGVTTIAAGDVRHIRPA